MSLVKPIALPMSAFSAVNSQEFKFSINGGDQVVKNRLTIRNNETNEIVYQQTQSNFAFVHTLPPNILTNGVYYNYYINTYNINNDISPNSEAVSFYCFSIPTLEFTNLVQSQTIETAEYTFNFTYRQIEGELLDEVVLYLYNSKGIIIKQSEIIRSTETPPINFSYAFSGLIDDENYSIQIIGRTIHDTVVKSNLVNFRVEYKYEGGLLLLELSNNCEEGYIKIDNNIISIDGDSYQFDKLKPPIYTKDNNAIELTNGRMVEWRKGFQLRENQLRITQWWKPTKVNVTVMAFGDDVEYDRDYQIEVKLKRGIDSVTDSIKDYLEIKGYKNNSTKDVFIYKRSNLVDKLNNNSVLITYINLNSEDATINLIVKDRDPNELNWNEESNVDYNAITDLYWINETTDYEEIQPITEIYEPNDDIITSVVLENGIVDHFNILRNTDIPYSDVIPTQWTVDTALDCNFKGNINGGDIDYVASQIDLIKIKRREVGKLDWVDIYSKPVSTVQDLMFDFKDYIVPTDKSLEYALVPCLYGGEQKYFTSAIDSKFHGLFISDITKSMKLYANVAYSTDNVKQEIGVLQPYNKRYPTIIKNPNVNYRVLSVGGTLLPFDENKRIDLDRNKMVALREEWNDFLTNGLPKVVKDWNGNIFIGMITTTPTYTYTSEYGMGIVTVSFTLTEQGQYDNQEDLHNNGFYVEVI